ncbi:hypothetical protein NECAME_07958, partial [Necator americanus]
KVLPAEVIEAKEGSETECVYKKTPTECQDDEETIFGYCMKLVHNSIYEFAPNGCGPNYNIHELGWKLEERKWIVGYTSEYREFIPVNRLLASVVSYIPTNFTLICMGEEYSSGW